MENELVNDMQNLSLNSESTHFPSEKQPSSRLPLSPNKETQINKLIEIDPNNAEKYKNYDSQNLPNINFEPENDINNNTKAEEGKIEENNKENEGNKDNKKKMNHLNLNYLYFLKEN